MQQSTPDSLPATSRKRKRKVLACNDCRRRKVQCDRNYPVCSRCEKAGRGADCRFEDDPGPDESTVVSLTSPALQPTQRRVPICELPSAQHGSSHSVTVSKDVWDDLITRLMHQEREIARYESTTQLPASCSAFSKSLCHPPAAIRQTKVSTVLRGKGFKTVFHGATDSRSSLINVGDLVFFARHAVEASDIQCSFAKQRKDFEFLKSIRKALHTSHSAETDLSDFVPGRDETDRLMQYYYTQVDSVFNILHVPSFETDYHQFWQAADRPEQSFVCLLLLCIACVQCLQIEKPHTYVANSSAARENAIKIIDACEAWLYKQSAKHVTLRHYQIRCLLVLAKRINSIKLKLTWSDAGNLLNHLMAAGFHRDPDLISKTTSAFDKEMRRRLWAMAIDLDVQISFDRGMPHHFAIAFSDCRPPSNLNDKDLEPLMSELPQPRPDIEITRSTYLRVSSTSLDLRKELATRLNDPKDTLSYQEIIKYAQSVEQHISGLTDLRGLSHPLNNMLRRNEGAMALLEMQMQQLLCTLHHAALQQPSIGTIAARFSTSAFHTAAQSLLRLHTTTVSSGHYCLLLARDDVVRVALTSASITKINKALLPKHSPESDLTQWTTLLDTALDLLQMQILRLGHLQPTYLFSFASSDYIRFCGEIPSETRQWPGVDRIIALNNKIFATQDLEFEAEVAKAKGEQIDGTSITSTSSVGGLSAGPGHVSSTEALFGDTNLADFSSWAFDDWPFDALSFEHALAADMSFTTGTV